MANIIIFCVLTVGLCRFGFPLVGALLDLAFQIFIKMPFVLLSAAVGITVDLVYYTQRKNNS